MDRKGIFDRLTAVFQDVFDDDSIAIGETTTAADIEEWDSLTNIMLLSAVEDEFNIMLDMESIQKLNNVGAMVNLIEKQAT